MMACKMCAEDGAREFRQGLWGHEVEGDLGRHFLRCEDHGALTVAPGVHDPRTFDLCYIATPYTKFPGGLDAAFVAAARLAGVLMCLGVKGYSPIAHCHPLAVHARINPLDHDVWLPFDEAQMRVAGCLIVAQLPTWSISFGVKHEIDFFGARGKPVVFLDPERLAVDHKPHAGLP